MLLEIITPQKVYFKEEVDLVRVPGENGSFAMMHNHAPIISSLEPGIIKITQLTSDRYFELLEQAIVEQHSDRVTILATRIEETYPILVR
jgi:F-type H+-transporting ATPase subunit epsilon